MQETQIRPLSWEDPLEEGMASDLSILAWEILLTEEPGSLLSVGSRKSQTRLKRLGTLRHRETEITTRWSKLTVNT